MPEISRFYGLIIKMYFLSSEHNPPHFHVMYGEDVAVFEIESGKMTDGYLPNRAIKLISEWLELHRRELLEIWNSQNFKHIEPLE